MSSIAPPCHTRGEETTDSWITPKWLIEKIGPFDLDPCASIPQPWPCARRQLTIEDNGLMIHWPREEFVYCNPPYGQATGAWLDRCSLHGNAVALVFARTETKAFFKAVWPRASMLLFLKGRLTFARPDGSLPKTGHNSGGPSVLIGYGGGAAQRLRANKELGALVEIVR